MEDATVAGVEPVWEFAIVEVFGHRRHVGRASEVERFGAKMIRIDVPKLGPAEGEITWSSHFYGGGSLFSYTPTDEKTVMNYAERLRAAPAAIPYRDHGENDVFTGEEEPHHDDERFDENALDE
ncbi:hypothetical protein [Bradyrhizobium sp. BR 10289]|uniref:hypothetical protein n=1 Tax=Bradyrhizobium sp. BR 10289 TaxID=2749993 RepID=UPI001C64B2C9|nr:hypothetical protein [Bradyrhizobium sp. BR 10289]MBW7968165.1 hypothetical protein [Bradyrhizobium sp. BR 10289]